MDARRLSGAGRDTRANASPARPHARHRAHRHVRRRGARRGSRDRAAAREPARARLPAGQARDRRRLGRARRTPPTTIVASRRRPRRPRVRLLEGSAWRQGGGPGSRGAAERAARSSPSPTRTPTWKPDALRKLVRNFADEDVAYVCGSHFYERGDGTNREGVYARFEGWLRQNESRFGSITAGVGPIYAVRREDYVELDPRFGHDLALPYLLVQRGRRAVVEPEALAWEKPARDIRRRVPPQDPDVRALLADPPAGTRAAPARPAVHAADGVAPPPALRERRPARPPARLLGRARPHGPWLPGGSRRPARACSAPPRPAAGSRATTSSSPGRPCRRFATTSAPGCRRCGRRPRGRDRCRPVAGSP